MEWRNRIIGYDTKPAGQFTPNPLNWRTHPSVQREALRGLLGDVGWVGAVLENKQTGNLIDGHARVEEALASDRDTPIPYLLVDLTPEEERLVLASFDPISALATADSKRLEELLKDVSSSSSAVDSLLAELAKEHGVLTSDEPKDAEPQIDKAAELQQKWGTETGQLWVIGNHRLLVGDATNKADVGHLMGNQTASLCFTSPPYLDQRDYRNALGQWDALMQGVFAHVPLTENGQTLVNLGLVHRDGEWLAYWDGWIEWMRSIGWRRFGWYVWDQGHGLPGDWNGRLAPSFEFVFHFNKQSVQAAKWVDKLPESVEVNTHGTGIRTKSGKMSGVSSPGASLQPTKVPDNIWRIMRYKARNLEGDHPAMFPVELPEFALRTWPGNVYDPFVGSGTTLVAAENLNRKCYAIEISPAYVAVCLERMTTAFPHLKIEKIDQARAA